MIKPLGYLDMRCILNYDKKIPDFKSLEEAANYWDTHSFADYIEDIEPVEIEVCLGTCKILLEIDRDLSEKLNKIAHT